MLACSVAEASTTPSIITMAVTTRVIVGIMKESNQARNSGDVTSQRPGAETVWPRVILRPHRYLTLFLGQHPRQCDDNKMTTGGCITVFNPFPTRFFLKRESLISTLENKYCNKNNERLRCALLPRNHNLHFFKLKNHGSQ